MSYPLTHPQKRIWYIEQTYPRTAMHNIGGTVRVQGRLDGSALIRAIELFVKSHQALRLQLTLQDGVATQYVMPDADPQILVHSFQTEADYHAWFGQEFEKPFPLYDSPLYQFAVFQIEDQEISGYFIKLHHIISDGWSVNLLTDHITAYYEATLRGEDVQPLQAPDYLERLVQEEKYFASDRCQKNRTYWNYKFHALPEGFLIKSSEDVRGKRKVYELDVQRSRKIREFADAQGASLNTVFVALMLLYLHRHTQASDIIIGMPVLNRSGQKEKKTFGMFTSTMPLRVSFTEHLTGAELLHYVNEEITASFFHQKYPFDKLVQDIELKKRGYESLFQVCVNFYNTSLNHTIDGLSIKNVEYYSGSQPYAMQLVIKEWSEEGRISLFVDYKTSDYTDGEINGLLERLMYLLDLMSDAPDAPLATLSLLTEAEQKDILEARNATQTDYPRDKTVVQLFEEQVERTPDAVAVRDGEQTWSYRELNEKANGLAKYVPRHAVTAVLARHSAEVVAGLLAVLKAGGTYLPLDPEHPEARIRDVLEDAQAQLLLTDGKVHVPDHYKGRVLLLGSCEGSTEYMPVQAGPNDLAYLIYTSGSTGKPKGAMIEHRGLVNYLTWAAKTYASEGPESFALYSSLAFDLTVTSLFTPLISGGEVVVYRDEGESFLLHRILEENRTTVLKLTPAHLALLNGLDLQGSSIKRLIVGGEDLKAAVAAATLERFGGSVEIYNEYGPTETVVGCMIHRYDRDMDTAGSVPIGRPIQNTLIYVLDQAGRPLPDGLPGEIYIGGAGVACGYLRRDDLTAERFTDNPFQSGTRLYKTGDLARWLSSGVLEYLGRIDHQVKIRGHRIELGEIENEMLRDGNVREAVVIDQEDERGQKYLVAYFVPSQEGIDTLQLRRQLTDMLPAYMVPSYLLPLERFPLTGNGKIDRAQLPDPLLTEMVVSEKEIGDIEAELLHVLKVLLQVETIGPRDNFYFLGGDSVKAIQLAAKLQERGLHIAVKDVLAYPVISDLAATIELQQAPLAPQTQATGIVPATPILSWFAKQSFSEADHWNQSVLLRVQQGVEIEHVQTALNLMVEHHDSLHLAYDCLSNTYQYGTIELVPLERITTTLSELAQHGERVKKSLNLATGPIFRAAWFDLEEGGQRLLLTAHHIAVDAVSWRVLLDDLSLLCEQISRGASPQLPPRSHPVQAFAYALQELGVQLAEVDRTYWLGMEQAEVLPPEFDQEQPHQTVGAWLTEEETKALLTTANVAYTTQANDLLITCLALAVQGVTGRSHMFIEMEGHGRESLFPELDLTRTVGWFTTMFPVSVQLPDREAGAAIKVVKEQVNRIPQKGIGYGILREVAKSLPDRTSPQIRFNYLGVFESELPRGLFTLATEDSGADISPRNPLTCGLDINAMVTHGQLGITIGFTRYRSQTVERLLDSFVTELRTILRHCGSGEGLIDFTPLDFDTVDLSQDDLDGLFD